MVMTVLLLRKLHVNFGMILTVGSSGFSEISETTSDLSLVFACGESHENTTDLFQNSREFPVGPTLNLPREC